MGLPAGQQRVLDGIADVLRVSEPRLAGMFAIFTRLTRNDPPPSQEQLLDQGHLAGLRTNLRSAAAWRSGTGLRVMIFAPVAIALALLVLLAGLNTRTPIHCASLRSQPVAAAVLRPFCWAQPNGAAATIGK